MTLMIGRCSELGLKRHEDCDEVDDDYDDGDEIMVKDLFVLISN